MKIRIHQVVDRPDDEGIPSLWASGWVNQGNLDAHYLTAVVAKSEVDGLPIPAIKARLARAMRDKFRAAPPIRDELTGDVEVPDE